MNALATARAALRGVDAHALYEEFCGVLCAESEGALGRAAYLARGVRQSLFAEDERAARTRAMHAFGPTSVARRQSPGTVR